MTYTVLIQPRAQLELEENYLRMSDYSPIRAVRWFNAIHDAIYSLKDFPARCSLAPESEAFKMEIRQLFFGKRNARYRVLFTIEDDTVHVLSVRHGARRSLEP
jgi:plasmid stabilization system protein ParE